jgi:hypothetical protein
MLARFTKCGECHSIAHDLNRWDATAQKPAHAPAAPAKKGSKKK